MPASKPTSHLENLNRELLLRSIVVECLWLNPYHVKLSQSVNVMPADPVSVTPPAVSALTIMGLLVVPALPLIAVSADAIL